uniref:Uncharacterized protein n=1 Tax=Arundo donax TaxID=35708 RepID=A0A0A9ACK1_ARUDO
MNQITCRINMTQTEFKSRIKQFV